MPASSTSADSLANIGAIGGSGLGCAIVSKNRCAPSTHQRSLPLVGSMIAVSTAGNPNAKVAVGSHGGGGGAFISAWKWRTQVSTKSWRLKRSPTLSPLARAASVPIATSSTPSAFAGNRPETTRTWAS